MTAHGGLFRTPGLPQRQLAAALRVPVALEATASEGGAWGIAVLAAYLEHAADTSLAEYLDTTVFGSAASDVVDPDQRDVDGFTAYLDRFRAALPIQAIAAGATTTPGATRTTGEPTTAAEPSLQAEHDSSADAHQQEQDVN